MCLCALNDTSKNQELNEVSLCAKIHMLEMDCESKQFNLCKFCLFSRFFTIFFKFRSLWLPRKKMAAPKRKVQLEKSNSKKFIITALWALKVWKHTKMCGSTWKTGYHGRKNLKCQWFQGKNHFCIFFNSDQIRIWKNRNFSFFTNKLWHLKFFWQINLVFQAVPHILVCFQTILPHREVLMNFPLQN